MRRWGGLAGLWLLVAACATGRAPVENRNAVAQGPDTASIENRDTLVAPAPIDSVEDRDTVVAPPRMASRGSPPTLRMPRARGSGRSHIKVTIQVEVDEHGRADMSTLKLTGSGAEANRTSIERWLEQAQFEPAQRGGTPVRGVYETSIEVRRQVRRLGARQDTGPPVGPGVISIAEGTARTLRST